MTQQKLKKELSRLPEGWIVLLETSAEKSTEVSLDALKVLTDKGYHGVIISASRPCSNLIKLYKKHKIRTKNLHILDCVSNDVKTKTKEVGSVTFVNNVCDLTHISLAINQSVRKTEGDAFIFIDSITTMLIYNKPQVFARFIHSVLTKMRNSGTSSLLISLEEETNKEVRAEIAQLCDKVVKL